MRQSFLVTAIAAGALLSGAIAAPAAVMHANHVAARAIEPVVNICGPQGCAPVQTKKVVHHRKAGNTVPHRL